MGTGPRHAAGAASAGAVVHFATWPLRRSRFGIPVLAEAEGLDGAGLSAYNTILYVWGATAALSILVDIPRGRRRWALLGLATFPLQRFSAAATSRGWVARRSRLRPGGTGRAGMHDGSVPVTTSSAPGCRRQRGW